MNTITVTEHEVDPRPLAYHPVVGARVWSQATTPTAAALREQLAEAGLSYPAIEAMVRETAPARHQSRVEAAVARAWEVAGALDCGPAFAADGVETDRYQRRRRTIAAVAVLLADSYGIGGRDGVEGLATTRFPGLEALGAGRKQAADGSAWDAAIRGAIEILWDRINPRGDRPRLWWMPEEGGVLALVAQADPMPEEGQDGLSMETVRFADFPRPWLKTIAREGLRRAAGLKGWHRGAGETWAEGDWISDWSALVEMIAEAEAEDARKPGVRW